MKKLAINLCIATAGLTVVTACQSNSKTETNEMTALPASITDYANYPTYAGEDLGVVARNNGCDFKLWSPMADSVALNIYANGAGGEALSRHYLVADKANGTWATSLKGDFIGKFYTFQVMIDGKWLDETPGVWAKAVGVNGLRAAIIDFKKTNPVGWENDKGPTTPML